MDQPNSGLSKLIDLQASIIAHDSATSQSLALVRDNRGTVNFFNTDFSKLETDNAEFIARELRASGILPTITSDNQQIVNSLENIKFFNTIYLTGFLSTSFSAEDEQKWTEIAETFNKVYNPNTGKLRELQDFFLFNISTSKPAQLLSRSTLSLEEELFIRSLLIEQNLNTLETFLFVSELNEKRTFTIWIVVGLFFLITWLIGLYKLCKLPFGWLKKYFLKAPSKNNKQV